MNVLSWIQATGLSLLMFALLPVLVSSFAPQNSQRMPTRLGAFSLLPPVTDLPLLEPLQPAALLPLPLSSSSLYLSATEGWRQYVPLVVISFVIVDILLGSPVANLALAPMRRAAEKGEAAGDDEAEGGGGGGMFGLGQALNPSLGSRENMLSSKAERIDSNAIAQQVLDKAKGTVELMDYLEANQSDEQRYEKIRKELDKQMAEVDDKLEGNK